MRAVAPSQLYVFRRTVNGTLTAHCSITRNGTLLNPQPTMPDGSPLRCRVSADKDQTIPGADSTQTMRRWVITLPDACPVQVSDRLTALNTVYSIVEIANPTTYSVSTTVYAYALYTLDSDGNPGPVLYLRFNAVVSTTRCGSPILTNVPVELTPAGDMAQEQEGGIIRYTARFGPTTIPQSGDTLYLQSWAPFTVDPSEPLRVYSPALAGFGGMAWVQCKIGEWVGN